VTQAQYGNILQCIADQCSVLTGGNPLVEPETADTITVGFTLNPTALPDLTMSVDWYEIEVKDIIGNIPLNSIFNACADGSQPEYCDYIVRTPFGTLFGDTIAGGGYIVGTNANVAKATFQGVDAQGSYRFDIGNLGSLVASLNAVYIIDTKTLPLAGATEYDCAGLYGNQCGPAVPDWRHSLRLSWLFPGDFQASLQWRYVDSVGHEANTDQLPLQLFDDDTGERIIVDFGSRLSARSYLDVAGSWDVTEQYSLRLGINNLTDKDPPLVDTLWSGPGTPNTWGPYDTLGRTVFFALNGRF
jgi:outer membrane receptor protein involved in Fe transport